MSVSTQSLSATPALRDTLLARAHEFGLPALLDALAALGFGWDQIVFRSEPSPAHKSFLVHHVEFQSTPPCAIVYLNIGLLAAQSPLPSYFFSLLDDGQHDRDALTSFLALFDHPLLRDWAQAQYPERDARLWPDWEEDKSLLLHLMALHSPSSLHWLFQRVYPELALHVTRLVQEQKLVTKQVIIGQTAIGESRALGGQVRLSAGALSVSLYCEETHCATGRPWAQEAAQRLDRYILPQLCDQNLFLDVWLIFFDSVSTAHLPLDPEHPDSFLGFDPLGQSQSSEKSRAISTSLATDTATSHRSVSDRSVPAIAGEDRGRQHVLIFSGHTDRG